ncbi:hypothetical protein RBSH_04279 [Rhodopirellula baltica SH28]|uniref:Uncharacterized protein n=1 Tax=Rhodopirellula baltica SH28 TaxID=993517 RepID=K5DD80_RHOBT|nr:hypothetical protein RBSH_04279 [Rhodopirellula baltica SH28]
MPNPLFQEFSCGHGSSAPKIVVNHKVDLVVKGVRYQRFLSFEFEIIGMFRSSGRFCLLERLLKRRGRHCEADFATADNDYRRFAGASVESTNEALSASVSRSVLRDVRVACQAFDTLSHSKRDSSLTERHASPGTRERFSISNPLNSRTPVHAIVPLFTTLGSNARADRQQHNQQTSRRTSQMTREGRLHNPSLRKFGWDLQSTSADSRHPHRRQNGSTESHIFHSSRLRKASSLRSTEPTNERWHRSLARTHDKIALIEGRIDV